MKLVVLDRRHKNGSHVVAWRRPFNISLLALSGSTIVAIASERMEQAFSAMMASIIGTVLTATDGPIYSKAHRIGA